MSRAIPVAAFALTSLLAIPVRSQSSLGAVSGTFRPQGCAEPAAASDAIRIVLVETS